MRKIGNKFWVIGTNPEHYFLNYLKHINILAMLEDVEIVNNSCLKIHDIVIDYGSVSTVKYNIYAWEAMGFIYAISDKKFIKLIPEYTEKDLLDIVFYSLFMPSNKERVRKFRDTILVKLNALVRPEELLINKYFLQKTRGYLSEEEIKKDIGNLEKRLMKNNEYKDIIKRIIEGN